MSSGTAKRASKAEGLPPLPIAAAVSQVPTALLWLRRDLRVADNPALVAALHGALRVVPVFVWAPEEEGQFQPGRSSRWWLTASLKALEADLQALGSTLIYRSAPESRTALTQLVQETGAQALFFNHLYDPISMVRDNEVKAAMAEAGITCYTFNSDVLYEPWEVLTPAGAPLVNFADFWERVQGMKYPPPLPLPVPASMPAVHPAIVGLDLSGLGILSSKEESSSTHLDSNWRPGGRGAHLLLEEFVLHRLKDFSGDRAKTDVQSTIRISPHVHYGEISTRHIYYAVKQQEVAMVNGGMDKAAAHASTVDFLRQLGYREYSRYLSFHFPFTHERSLLEHLRACPWRWDQSHFKAWRQGRTGYPLVDAGMRELWSTGWMHNRMRVVCASFLVKNLLLPWQWGLKHYWDAQLDADLECAALGWQYCSGCLADAHTFGYMLDHKTEALRFDPSGNYARRWLPVLSRLPTKWIHRPHEAPADVLQDAGVELGVNYEAPIISVAESRAHVQHACLVIDRCLARTDPEGSESGQTEPYRLPSAPSSDAAQQQLPHQRLPSGASVATSMKGGQAGRIASGQQPTAPEVPLAPQFDSSDEEVLSNTLADGLAGADAAMSSEPHSEQSGALHVGLPGGGAAPANDAEPAIVAASHPEGPPGTVQNAVSEQAAALAPAPEDEPMCEMNRSRPVADGTSEAAGEPQPQRGGGGKRGRGSAAVSSAAPAGAAAAASGGRGSGAAPASSRLDAVVPGSSGIDLNVALAAAESVREADEIATAAAKAASAHDAEPSSTKPAAKRKRKDEHQ